MALCPGETTQWEDIHRKNGNWEWKERQDDAYLRRKRNAAERAVIDAAEQLEPLEHCGLEQLDSLEDDGDEDVLAKYRRQRMAELKQKQREAKFGEVKQVCKGDFVREVTEGSADGQWVCVLLYVDARQACHAMFHPWAEVARRFPNVKFMKGIATEVVADFPDRSTPAVIIYRSTECEHQIIGVERWGGPRCSADIIEWELARLNVVQSELEEDPRLTEKAGASPWHRQAQRRSSESESEDEDATADRCYSSLRLGRKIGHER
eukprot:TRINITY_DN41395_c0_g1_i1.p1 TRINITY_DN41395_c0_g1~~TRINITY_DN41395_c0_g1_i1.p1  ORF type:complete len:264 (-),score=69.21 TRINITY_DN41395_c0_g1_i1:119-910(-)